MLNMDKLHKMEDRINIYKTIARKMTDSGYTKEGRRKILES